MYAVLFPHMCDFENGSNADPGRGRKEGFSTHMETPSSPGSIRHPRTWPFVTTLIAILLAGVITVVAWTQFAFLSSLSQLTAARDSRTNSERDFSSKSEDVVVSSGFQLDEQQKRGKQIYLTCTSASGDKIMAVLGNSNTEIPAAVLTCVNCHRHDGRGKPEGGIFPSNIRWDELTKPYRVNLPHGQSRPPYDESLVRRCVTMGLNPAGKRLDDAMPRYRMTHRDLADLISYLKVLGSELDPGLSADTIRIGVILAPRSQFQDLHDAGRAAVTAFVEEYNQLGGVYKRRIKLCFSEAPSRIEDRAEAAVDFVNSERVFALTSSFIAGAETEIIRQLDKDGVPLLGAVTLYPQHGFPLSRSVFYLGSGLIGQSCALVNFVAHEKNDQRLGAVVVFPDEERLTAVASAIENKCRDLGMEVHMQRVGAHTWRPIEWSKSLSEQKIGIVFSLLSAQQNLQLLNAAETSDWFPVCCIPGSIVGPQLFSAPAGFDQRIFLSFPTLPSQQPGGMNTLRALAKRHDLPDVQLGAQFEALAALQVLTHGLEKSGAQLSRENLIEQLEGLYEYRSGFMVPITYGPNRRMGAEGAYIVTLDLTRKKLVTASDWIDGAPASQLTH